MKNNFFKKQSGLTLMELIMAIAILTMGMAGISLLFTRVWKTNSYTIEMGQASMAASQGVERIVSYLRSARQGDNGSYAIQLANDNEFIFYADYDKDMITERLHIYKNGVNILMGITDPADTFPITYPSGDQQTITLVTNVVNDDAPIFYYYDNQYAGDPSDGPMVIPAALSDIRLVRVYLQINIRPNNSPDNIEMQSFVEMRNLNDYDRA